MPQGVMFYLQCPGNYSMHPSKLVMFQNGSVSKNTQYKEICNGKIPITVAQSNHAWTKFRLDKDTNSMVEIHGKGVLGGDEAFFEGEYSAQTYDWEILKPFFLHHNIVPTWIDAAGTRYKVVEKVNKINVSKVSIMISIILD